MKETFYGYDEEDTSLGSDISLSLSTGTISDEELCEEVRPLWPSTTFAPLTLNSQGNEEFYLIYSIDTDWKNDIILVLFYCKILAYLSLIGRIW